MSTPPSHRSSPGESNGAAQSYLRSLVLNYWLAPDDEANLAIVGTAAAADAGTWKLEADGMDTTPEQLAPFVRMVADEILDSSQHCQRSESIDAVASYFRLQQEASRLPTVETYLSLRCGFVGCSDSAFYEATNNLRRSLQHCQENLWTTMGSSLPPSLNQEMAKIIEMVMLA